MAPCFIGPRQITALSLLSRKKSTEMTLTPATSIGRMALFSLSVCAPLMPSMVGMLGPWKSTSISPTRWPAMASVKAMLTDTVLFPTPPLPQRTMILCLIFAIWAMNLSSRSLGSEQESCFTEQWAQSWLQEFFSSVMVVGVWVEVVCKRGMTDALKAQLC